MISLGTFEAQLQSIKGKTIAVVYIFENEDAPGFAHYWIWKSNIITGWLNAIQELSCVPFILDVRTFAHKAMNRTLPHIDFVINLNCGSYELSSMSLVPSICSFMSVPCIPCDAASIVMTENKRISNLLATAMNINVPRALPSEDQDGIFRPLNLGSSIGITRGRSSFAGDGVYQEFIPGYDVTIPVVYNPATSDIDLLVPIIYLPNTMNPQWIYDATEKVKDDGFTTLPALLVTDELRKALIEYCRIFPIQTYGRVDGRIKSHGDELLKQVVQTHLDISDLYFIEINSMPTIESNDSFEYALNSACECQTHSFHLYGNYYRTTVENPTINGFLLSCSMIALSKAKC